MIGFITNQYESSTILQESLIMPTMSIVLLLQFQVFHSYLNVTNTFEKSKSPDMRQIFL